MTRVMLLVLAALIHTSALGQALETLKPGIVRITTKPEGMRQTGTGFIVKLEPGIAYILTAYHVVAGDNAPQVEFFSRRNQPVKAGMNLAFETVNYSIRGMILGVDVPGTGAPKRSATK